MKTTKKDDSLEVAFVIGDQVTVSKELANRQTSLVAALIARWLENQEVTTNGQNAA